MKTRMQRVLGFAAVLVVSLAGVSVAQSEAEGGQKTFKAHCALCHGADGTGKTNMGKQLNVPDLHSADVQKMSVDEMTHLVKNGKDPMPSFQDQLSDAEIAKVVGYVRTFKQSGK